MWLYKAVTRVSLMLGACGFQVRGPAEFPPGMSAIYIDTQDRYTPFYRAMATTIRETDTKLTDDPTRADTVIRVLRDDSGQRVLSVSARNVPLEYRVFYTIQYAVVVQGEQVLPPQSVTRTLDYIYDENEVLGMAVQEQTLTEAIARDRVGLVTRRIASIN